MINAGDIVLAYMHCLLSDGTIHGVIRRTGVGRKGLGFNLCVVPPHDRVVPNLGVMVIMEVFQSTPEKAEETRGSKMGTL